MNDVHRIDRLADKHVEAGGACLAHAKSFMEERYRYSWRRPALIGAPGAEPSNELQPILIRQNEVADHDVRNHRLDRLLCLGGGLRRDDAGAERLEAGFEQMDGRHIVINHQRGNAG